MFMNRQNLNPGNRNLASNRVELGGCVDSMPAVGAQNDTHLYQRDLHSGSCSSRVTDESPHLESSRRLLLGKRPEGPQPADKPRPESGIPAGGAVESPAGALFDASGTACSLRTSRERTGRRPAPRTTAGNLANRQLADERVSGGPEAAIWAALVIGRALGA